jgi:hypothetical protein
MFFRRERPKVITFEERLDALTKAGFAVERLGSGRARVVREGVAAVVESGDQGQPRLAERAGLLIGNAVGTLVDGGFQKFFRTPDGRKQPAQAAELRAIHCFQEGLREALGMTTLYNEALGTVSTRYLYDRVKDRDHGVPKRPWE